MNHDASVKNILDERVFSMASFRSSILRFLIRKTVNWNKSFVEIRTDLERLNKKADIPQNIKVQSVSAGGVKAELIEPEGAPSDKIVIYLHGGGYCLGIVNTNRGFVAKIAAGTGLKTLLVDYRLAPENPFPAAIEDVITAYRWLLSKGHLSRNMIFVADSSGCGLCLAALMSLRDDKVSMPAAMAFISPMVDLAGTGESFVTRKDVDPFQYLDPLCIIKNYIGDNDPMLPVLSPLFGDLQGLPPILIHASDYDVFLSDAVRLAEKASESGIEVNLKIWDRMWHIFHMNANLLPEAKTALEEIFTYIKNKIG